MKTSELKQQRATLLAEARNVAESAVKESRALSQDEQNKINDLTSSVDALDITIKAAEDVEKRTRELASSSAAIEDTAVAESKADEYRSAFETYVRYGKDSLTGEQFNLLRNGLEARADTIMVKGTGNVGGYTVPTSFLPKIVEKLEQNSPIYALANKVNTDSGEDLQVPQVTAHASASWISENSGAFDSVSDTFAQVTLKAYSVAELAKLSVQLLQDNAVDLEGYLARNIGGSVGRTVGNALAVGAANSTTTPQGLITSANATTLATGHATSFSADDLIDLTHAITPPYRNGAVFLMHDATIGFVRKLKDSSNRYLWAINYGDVVQGEGDRLLGFPVYAEPNMDQIAASKTVVGFGNPELAYMVRQAGGFNLRRLDERFADTFLVGFLGWMRIDGKLVDANAFQTLKTSAT